MAYDKETELLREPQRRDRSEIDALLKRVAQESRREAPLSVRQHLRGMIQRQNSPRRSIGQGWLLPAAGIAAALVFTVAVILAISAFSSRRSHNERVSMAPPTATASDRGLNSPLAIDIQKPATPLAPQPTRARQRKPPSAVRAPESMFVVLPFSDRTLASGTSLTIRLALSDAELLALGVAPDENKRGQLSVADVVLGDDGLPRAIRLLPNLTAIQGGS